MAFLLIGPSQAMVRSLLGSELRGHLRRWTTWLYFGLLFLLGFAVVASGLALELGKINDPSSITLAFLVCVMLGEIITSALAGMSIPRDANARVGELLATRRLTRNGYLAAKFLAAFTAMLLVFCALPLSYLAASMIPWLDRGSIAPLNGWNYLQPFLTVVVPDVLFFSALFFALGAVTRKQWVVAATSVLLLLAVIMVYWIANDQLAMLLDPFGAYPIVTTLMSGDGGIVPLTGYLLLNRLLWCGISVGLLAVAFLSVKLETEPRQRMRARRAVPVFAIVVVALFFGLDRYGAAQEKARQVATQAWLASHAIRLRTVEARNGFEDMQPLKKVIGDAHVVALGEATHGTREFFQLKHRMLEFLVTEMGFTVFGIEATMPEAFDVNEYVLTGKGDPGRALNGLYFWTWNTEEVLDMIQWMRQYNADPTHLHKVKFYGFDMQFAPLAVKRTLAYLRKVDPDEAADAAKVLSPLANPIVDSVFLKSPADQQAAMLGAIDAVVRRFDGRKSEYIAKTSESEWAVARQHASIVAQNLEMRSAAGSNSVRDSSMAANIRWILDGEGPGAKMVVWAHNMHVATQAGMMGGHLRQALGADMVVFGFAFNEGGFQAIETPLPSARGRRSFTVGPSPAGSLDATLAAAGLQIAAVDLRTLPTEGVVAKWFGAARKTHFIGSMHTDQLANSLISQVAPREYDALLFVERTTAARPNQSSNREAPQKLDKSTNLDFETSDSGQPPEGWITAPWMRGLGFESAATSSQPYSGKWSAMLSRPAGDYYGESFGSLTQRIDATAYRLKHIRLRMMARTDAAGAGNHAYVGLEVARMGNMNTDPITQPVTSTEWRSYEIEVDVPANTVAIAYGMYLVGTGRVWMDDVSLEVVPKSRQGGGSSRPKKP